MEPASLGDLFSDPGFQTLLLTVLAVVANVVVGVSMLPRDARKRLYPTHRLIYVLVLACFAVFLVIRHFSRGNPPVNYFVFLYFLLVVPLTRRIHLTLHAVLASVGLALLLLVAAANI